MQIRLLIGIPILALLSTSLLIAQKKESLLPEHEAKIHHLLQDLDSIKGDLKNLASKRKQLLEEMTAIRLKERSLREEESAIRSKISALKKGQEIKTKLSRQDSGKTKLLPLVEGPIKHGNPMNGTLISVNPSAGVVSISTLSKDKTVSNHIYLLGVKAAIIADSLPKQLSEIETPTKVTYWIHPQDASTITWLEIQTR